MIQKIQIVNTARTVQVDESWLRLISFVQTHPFCTLEVVFKDGKPNVAARIIETHKFS